ncbi:MAG: hypothetical protein ABID83_02775, partial [Candidatus Omnitrophota bacterium]
LANTPSRNENFKLFFTWPLPVFFIFCAPILLLYTPGELEVKVGNINAKAAVRSSNFQVTLHDGTSIGERSLRVCGDGLGSIPDM